MPRTPAPLTAQNVSGYYMVFTNHGGKGWIVKDSEGLIRAYCHEEADARAFVALPALEDKLANLESAARLLVDYLRHSERWPVKSEHMGYLSHIETAIKEAALAAADGPSQEQG